MTTATDEISSTPAPVKAFTAGHTPGPWIKDDLSIRSPDGDHIIAYSEDGCHLNPDVQEIDEQTQEANAHLIAAAPDGRDLADAFEDMLLHGDYEFLEKRKAMLKRIAAYKAKADGETA